MNTDFLRASNEKLLIAVFLLSVSICVNLRTIFFAPLRLRAFKLKFIK